MGVGRGGFFATKEGHWFLDNFDVSGDLDGEGEFIDKIGGGGEIMKNLASSQCIVSSNHHNTMRRPQQFFDQES